MKMIGKAIGRSAAPLLLAIFASIVGASAQTSGPQIAGQSGFASAADIQAQVDEMVASMKPDQGFTWRPLVRDGATVAAIEIWRKPGRPAIHPAEAEYAIVLEGSGTLVSGGTLANPAVRNVNLIEGTRIEGGATRALSRGDVILISPGTPHWFGITGDRLVLLGMKLPEVK